MCRRMRIATNHGHAGHSRSKLRSHYMDNALTHFIHLEFFDTKMITIVI